MTITQLVLVTLIIAIVMTAAWAATWVALSAEQPQFAFVQLLAGGLAALVFHGLARVTHDQLYLYMMVAGYACAAATLHAILCRMYLGIRYGHA